MHRSNEIANWGNYPRVSSRIAHPNSQDNIIRNLSDFGVDVIARGNGRCYGDAALASNIISTLKLNKFLSFDENLRIITVESGVLLSEILEFAVPKGLFLPVTPGTKFITVGGALAADVHGKNHHKDGCFSDWVHQFTIIDASDMQIKICNRSENVDLFWSTIGGMGLTGIIIDVTFQLIQIETSFIRQESIKAKDLDEIIKLFEDSEEWTYTVAWIDCLQKGKNLGRSIMMRGEHAHYQELPSEYKLEALQVYNKSLMTVPFYFPNFTLNTLSVKAFNLLYYYKQLPSFKKHFNNYGSFFYPLDVINNWNKIYGKKGFIQYQFVIPLENAREGLIEILETISKSGQGSFLSVLKKFGQNNPSAFNSFPIPGYTLALDFKINNNLKKLVNKLDEIVLKFNGRIYRAKDSMSRPELTNYLVTQPSLLFNSIQNKRISQTACH